MGISFGFTKKRMKLNIPERKELDRVELDYQLDSWA